MTRGTRKIVSVLTTVLAAFFLPACGMAILPVPTLTATASAVPTSTATPSPLPTETPIPTPTPTLEPAWYRTLSPSEANSKYQYAQVTNPRARVYPTFQDALDKSFNYGHFPYSPAYVAYTSTKDEDGRTFYNLATGNWMDGQDLQLLTPSHFSGVLLTRQVDFRFGWVLASTQSVNAAGGLVNTYSRYQIVHEVSNTEAMPGYVAIGADEWLPETSVAWVQPQAPVDADLHYCRFLYVNLAQQTLSVYEGCKLIFATLISSGADPLPTYAGRFNILYKIDYTTLQPPEGSITQYYLEGVPDFMTYYYNLGFHGAYWHDNFGAPASHGCINLSLTDIQWLYAWVQLGDRVIISPGK